MMVDEESASAGFDELDNNHPCGFPHEKALPYSCRRDVMNSCYCFHNAPIDDEAASSLTSCTQEMSSAASSYGDYNNNNSHYGQSHKSYNSHPINTNVVWFDGIAMPMFAVHRSGCVSSWNACVAELTACPAQDIIHQPLHYFIGPQSRPELHQHLQLIFEGSVENTTCNVTFRPQQQQQAQSQGIKSNNNKDDDDSHCRRLRLKLSCHKNPSGSIVGAFCVAEHLQEPSSSVVFQGTSPGLAIRKEDSEEESDTDDNEENLSSAVAVPSPSSSSSSSSLPYWEFQQLLASASEPIFAIDSQGRVNEWNHKCQHVTGYSAEEALGKDFIESFVSAHQQDSLRQVLESVLHQQEGTGTLVDVVEDASSDDDNNDNNNNQNYKMKLEIVTKSHVNITLDVRYWLVHFSPRRDYNGNLVGVMGMVHDVTEDTQQDRELAETANELRLLIDNANAIIFGIDLDGNVNEWNNKCTEITGFCRDEAMGAPLLETFIGKNMQESVRDILNAAFQGRGTSNFMLEFSTKWNEIRNLLVNATTRRNSHHNIVGVVIVAQDITEAAQRDRAVAAMALELRQLIDTANAPIFGIDSDGNVNEWNRRLQQITGFSKDEAFDEPLVETFIAPEMRGTVQRILDSALEGVETSNYEVQFITRTGEIRYLLVNATTRRDPENHVVGVVGVAQDVTDDRKHAKELREMHSLKASQEAKVETERNMTAWIAHELRNPLGAIDSALIAMPDDLPPSAKCLVTGMQLCSSFMSGIMNNLLDVRKMEEGKMTLHIGPLSLKKLVTSVHRMLLPSVRHNVEFTTSCTTECRDYVLGDEHRIKQVLTNVLTNAIKYTSKGSIHLSVGWRGDDVCFTCADTGPGIPKNDQKKLFQRFAKRGGAPGTGLGLAIAKHLVDLSNGSIRFESDPSVRAGTTCILTLPLVRCNPPQEIVETDEDATIISEPIRVFLIDDVKMNRLMLKKRILKGIAPNAVIMEAATGEEALDILAKNEFDIVVVDQYMEAAGGALLGTDVVFAMRRMNVGSLIIGCSGNDLEEEFKEAGADAVWKKPLPSNKRILEAWKDFLDNR